jgi:prepilin-type N-terminal cleavage/methylation domain-containing protein
MKLEIKNSDRGFSMIELVITMTMMVLLTGLVATLFSQSWSLRSRESRRTDALTSAHAALNVLSREIANSGYGLKDNGIVLTDSNSQRLHFRSNIQNNNTVTTDPGEDVTYFYDSPSRSIVRYERTLDPATGNIVGTTSAIVNRISQVDFLYFNYAGSSSTATTSTTPTADTCRVQLTVAVQLEPVPNMPNQTVTFTSDVTLRNSNYMLNQY